MSALIPPINAAAPKKSCDFIAKFESSSSLRGLYAEASQPSRERLLRSNGQRIGILFDRVGNWPSKLQSVEGSGAGAVLQEVRARQGVHSGEVCWISDRCGMDNPQVDSDIWNARGVLQCAEGQCKNMGCERT